MKCLYDEPTLGALRLEVGAADDPIAAQKWQHVVAEPALGLRFGAFDFVISDGGPVFLECNQNGEWGWLEQGTGAPIASAVVAELVSS